MKRIGFFLLLVFSFSTGLVAQSSAPLQESVVKGGWGTVQNGKFISEKLGLTLSVPPEYNLISSVDAQILANAGVDMLKQGTASDTKIDEAVGRSILLVAIAEKPIGSPQNSALELVTTKQKSGVTAAMSLAASLMVLKGTPYKLRRSLGSIKLGPNTFAAAELDATFGEIKFMQRMYVVMNRGHSIVCVITYYTDVQRLEMEKVLSTLVLTR